MSIVSVSEITRYIKSELDGNPRLRNVLIRGEISNFKGHSSGHCYFTLKDTSASIKAVMFRSKAQYLKFIPVNGMKIVAEGYITVFERDGQYQLYVNNLFPEGVGELSIAFEQLKEKLTAEGLFEQYHKKALPAFPKTVGVVTSQTGAVLRDICTVTKRRNTGVGIRLYPVQVQGADAAEQIAAAIRFFNEKYPVDVLIVGRGGGSIEDLWAFNEEAVVRAIYRSEIPIVSAVGHETDYTLADFVSDVRAATPSQAAEMIVPDVRGIMRHVQSLRGNLNGLVRRIFEEKERRLDICRKSKALMNPDLILADKRQILDDCVEKMARYRQHALTDKQHHLHVLLEKLEMLNPLAVVSRGYAIARIGNTVLRRVTAVKKGDQVEVILEDGAFDAVVNGVRRGQMMHAQSDK